MRAKQQKQLTAQPDSPTQPNPTPPDEPPQAAVRDEASTAPAMPAELVIVIVNVNVPQYA